MTEVLPRSKAGKGAKMCVFPYGIKLEIASDSKLTYNSTGYKQLIGASISNGHGETGRFSLSSGYLPMYFYRNDHCDQSCWLNIYYDSGQINIRFHGSKFCHGKDIYQVADAKSKDAEFAVGITYENQEGSGMRWGFNKRDTATVLTIKIRSISSQPTVTPTKSKLSAVMTECKFTQSDTLLEPKKRAEFVSEHSFHVPEHVGATVEKTFKKTIVQSFAWGLDQTIGASAAVEFNASLPGLGGTKTKLGVSASFGANQDWVKSTQYECSFTEKVEAKSAGHYTIAGWVDIAQDVELPFTGQFRITATGEVWKDGKVQIIKLGAKEIEGLLEKEGFAGKILRRNTEDLEVEMTGKVKATYYMKSYTTVTKD